MSLGHLLKLSIERAVDRLSALVLILRIPIVLDRECSGDANEHDEEFQGDLGKQRSESIPTAELLHRHEGGV